MKKTILFGLLSLFVSGLFAQDLKKVKSYLEKKELDKAKSEIDAYSQKNPNNPEGLYYKGKIYESISQNEQFKSLAPDALPIAFDALTKAVEADKDNKMILLLTENQYKPSIVQVYDDYFKAGISSFNNAVTTKNKADFEVSMNNFIKANEIGNYIAKKKWGLSEIDTSLILNIGQVGMNAGIKDTTLKYFKMLADANVTRTRDSTVYSLPYRWLAEYYRDAKDEATFLKYVNLGKQYFPADDYFDVVLIDYYRAKKDNKALFKAYSETVAKYPDSLVYHINYANEVFNYIYASDAGTKIENRDELLKTVEVELEKSAKLNLENVTTNWLYGQYYYNSGVDTKEKAVAIKGAKPEDVKAKADLNAQAKVLFSKAIPYAERALSGLEAGFKKSEKSKYKSVSDLMQKIYAGLNQSDKVKFYEDKYDTADTKFVN